MILNQFYDLIEDILYKENGQWAWPAMSEFARIELKINNHQSEIKVAELSLMFIDDLGYPAHFFLSIANHS